MAESDWEDEEEEFESGNSDLALEGGPEFAAYCIRNKRWSLEHDDVLAEFLRVRRKYPLSEADEDEDCEPPDHFAYVVARKLAEARLLKLNAARRLQGESAIGFIHHKLNDPGPMAPLPPEMGVVPDEFAAWPLFSAVGQPIKEAGAASVTSWRAALEVSDTSASVNFGTTMMNRLMNHAIRHRGEAWRQEHWNGTIDAWNASFQAKLVPSSRNGRPSTTSPCDFGIWFAATSRSTPSQDCTRMIKCRRGPTA